MTASMEGMMTISSSVIMECLKALQFLMIPLPQTMKLRLSILVQKETTPSTVDKEMILSLVMEAMTT